jgi:arylsulfatase A-like enzyme
MEQKPMTSRMSGSNKPGQISSPSDNRATQRLRFLPILVLSAWCGVVAGLLETGITILRKRYIDLSHANGVSVHFVWLVPSVNIVLFVLIGLILTLLARRGVRGEWFAGRGLATLALLPLFWAAFPRIYAPAGLLLMMGLAAKLIPALERRAAGFARVVRLSFPAAVGLVAILAASCLGTERLNAWRETSRPLPPSSSPNVLLIVLDTVGAGHLSTFGYDRATSPTIDELARRGIRFDRAQATAPWTLPSHASMFTGRWPHEFSAGWLTPLDSAFPILAEYLGAKGYATAGFAANLEYCTSVTGLARGFTTYRDFIYPKLAMFHLAVIVDRVLDGIHEVESFFTRELNLPFLRYPTEVVWDLFKQDRKEAAVVNREFLDWLSGRQRQDRPFFVFLNFYDAHGPYELPATGLHRFGVAANTGREIDAIRDWLSSKKRLPSQKLIGLARDSYDNCVADLDEQLGKLIDELKRRGVLDRTWVIVAGDHGENFGEHPGVFLHGTTVFRTECHVPLVIIPPGGASAAKVVADPVSLRDLAATIVDVSGSSAGSPFPGESLVRFWDTSRRAAHADAKGPSPSLVELAPQEDSVNANPLQSDDLRWPLAALVEKDWSYIKREGHIDEQLFYLRKDTAELRNLAADPAARPTLERMREALGHLTAGPLTPDRFNP